MSDRVKLGETMIANALQAMRKGAADAGDYDDALIRLGLCEYASRLVQAVTEDGAARGGRDFVFWNPPFADEAKSARRSSNSEATALFAELVRKGIRSLVFANTRKLTELIYIYTRNRLTEIDRSLAERRVPPAIDVAASMDGNRGERRGRYSSVSISSVRISEPDAVVTRL